MGESLSSVLTEGFGAWGSVNLMTTLGYGLGVAQADGPICGTLAVAGIVSGTLAVSPVVNGTLAMEEC